MFTHEKQTIVESVLYILKKTGSLDYYHIFKILYFANAEMLAQWGKGIIADKFCALPDGPVPTALYDCFKGNTLCDHELMAMIGEAMSRGYEDATFVITPLREPNMNYISKVAAQFLDKSIEENAKLTFNELRNKSHDAEWLRAFSTGGRKVMLSSGIASAFGATQDVVEYIDEMEEIEQWLVAR